MATRQSKSRAPLMILGWREWIALPGLGVARIKAKLDTGALTSALHASDITRFERDGEDWVRFVVHPEQRTDRVEVACECPLLDVRKVRSSSGQASRRPTIRTALHVAGRSWPIDLTLVGRDDMGFRMLLGRRALRGRALIDPAHAFTAGTLPKP